MTYDELLGVVSLAQNGDGSAFSTIYEQTHNKMYFYAVKIVGADNAEDVLQNSYIDMIRNINSLDDPKAFVGWFKKIVYNECVALNKKNGKYITSDEDTSILDMLEDDDGEFLPSEAFDNLEKRKLVLDAIDKLPDAQKHAVLMFYFDELSIKQIAEVMGTNENTVKSHLTYARRKLAKSLGEKKSRYMLGVAPFPLIVIMLREAATETVMSQSQAVTVALGISDATGVSFTAANAATQSAITVPGLLTKVAAFSVPVKIIGVAAVAGVIALAVLPKTDQTIQTVSSIAAYTSKQEETQTRLSKIIPSPEPAPTPEPVPKPTPTPTPEPTEVINPYVGTYRNNEGEGIEIIETEDGQLMQGDNILDLTNIQDDGSILAHVIKYEQYSISTFIYPAGIELSAWNHMTNEYEDSDNSKLRMFFWGSDTPDIRSNVWYKTELLPEDTASYLPEAGSVHEYDDRASYGEMPLDITTTEYVFRSTGVVEGDIIEGDTIEDNELTDYLRYDYRYFEDATGLYRLRINVYPESERELLLKYPLTVGEEFKRYESGETLCIIQSIDETVTTPAGVFEDAVKVEILYLPGDRSGNEYYAPGMGLIRDEYMAVYGELVNIR